MSLGSNESGHRIELNEEDGNDDGEIEEDDNDDDDDDDEDDRFRLIVRDFIRVPDQSDSNPGFMNVYSPISLPIRAKESVVLDLKFDMIVPKYIRVALLSRERLVRDYGVECVSVYFGTGTHERVALRLVNHSAMPWWIEKSKPVALLKVEHYYSNRADATLEFVPLTGCNECGTRTGEDTELD